MCRKPGLDGGGRSHVDQTRSAGDQNEKPASVDANVGKLTQEYGPFVYGQLDSNYHKRVFKSLYPSPKPRVDESGDNTALSKGNERFIKKYYNKPIQLSKKMERHWKGRATSSSDKNEKILASNATDLWYHMALGKSNQELSKYFGPGHYPYYAYNDSGAVAREAGNMPFTQTDWGTQLSTAAGLLKLYPLRSGGKGPPSQKELACLRTFLETGFYSMNNQARKQASFENPLIKKSIECMQSCLLKLANYTTSSKPVIHNAGKLFRGAYITADAAQKYAVGNEFISSAFQSTSPDRHLAQGFKGNYFFVVDTSKQNSTARSAEVARTNDEEFEVLYPIGTKFKVTSRTPWMVMREYGGEDIWTQHAKKLGIEDYDSENPKALKNDSGLVICDNEGNLYDQETISGGKYAIKMARKKNGVLLDNKKTLELSLVDSETLEEVKGVSLADLHPPIYSPDRRRPLYFCEVHLEECSAAPDDVQEPAGFYDCPDFDVKATNAQLNKPMPALRPHASRLNPLNDVLDDMRGKAVRLDAPFDQEAYRFFSNERTYARAGLSDPPHGTKSIDDVRKEMEANKCEMTVKGYLEMLRKNRQIPDFGFSDAALLRMLRGITCADPIDEDIHKYFSNEQIYKRAGFPQEPYLDLTLKGVKDYLKEKQVAPTVGGYLEMMADFSSDEILDRNAEEILRTFTENGPNEHAGMPRVQGQSDAQKSPSEPSDHGHGDKPAIESPPKKGAND